MCPTSYKYKRMFHKIDWAELGSSFIEDGYLIVWVRAELSSSLDKDTRDLDDSQIIEFHIDYGFVPQLCPIIWDSFQLLLQLSSWNNA